MQALARVIIAGLLVVFGAVVGGPVLDGQRNDGWLGGISDQLTGTFNVRTRDDRPHTASLPARQSGAEAEPDEPRTPSSASVEPAAVEPVDAGAEPAPDTDTAAVAPPEMTEAAAEDTAQADYGDLLDWMYLPSDEPAIVADARPPEIAALEEYMRTNPEMRTRGIRLAPDSDVVGQTPSAPVKAKPAPSPVPEPVEATSPLPVADRDPEPDRQRSAIMAAFDALREQTAGLLHEGAYAVYADQIMTVDTAHSVRLQVATDAAASLPDVEADFFEPGEQVPMSGQIEPLQWFRYMEAELIGGSQFDVSPNIVREFEVRPDGTFEPIDWRVIPKREGRLSLTMKIRPDLPSNITQGWPVSSVEKVRTIQVEAKPMVNQVREWFAENWVDFIAGAVFTGVLWFIGQHLIAGLRRRRMLPPAEEEGA
ncbi:MAG: hypothetical protein ACFB3T_08200 [Geminicoccaceae bacterium]